MRTMANKLYFLILMLAYAVGVLPSQTLLRRTEPPALRPESCRDHVADQRRVFLRAAVYARDRQEKNDLGVLANDLAEPKFSAWLCARPRALANLDVLASLAEYARRVRLSCGEGKCEAP
jgi:hypothetical protein